jgi:hypothetical protein
LAFLVHELGGECGRQLVIDEKHLKRHNSKMLWTYTSTTFKTFLSHLYPPAHLIPNQLAPSLIADRVCVSPKW